MKENNELPMGTDSKSPAAYAAWTKAAQIFSYISKPVNQYILTYLSENKEATALQMTCSEHSYKTLLKNLAGMEKIGLVRKEKLGNDTNWKIIYAKITTLNSAAARLL